MDYDDDMISDETHEDVSDKFLDRTELESQMRITITDAQSVLQVDRGVCRLLLQKYNWNQAMLFEKFYESPDFLIDAGIVPKKQESPPEEMPTECDICCSENKLLGLDCYHFACEDCWNHYLSEKIKEKQSEIQCMASDCKLLIPDEKVKEFINTFSLGAQFYFLILNSYVEANPNLTWCPGPDCGRAVKVNHCETRLITCPCGTIFCFTCGNEGHDPVSCHNLKLWKKKCDAVQEKKLTDGFSSDEQTFKWILSNTKDCPKCLVAIQKNGGCNRMLCTNKRCRFEFCWLCLKSWEVHGYWSCNSFNSDAEKNRVDSRAELHRFLFYFNRYLEHGKSLKLEEKIKESVRLKMEKMQTKTMTWTDVQYLKKSVGILSECRRTLMFTYVFAFYLERNNQALIFENNQKDLEMAVEQLSGFLEQDMEKEDLVTLKQKVLDKCSYVERRRKALLDHCADGNIEDSSSVLAPPVQTFTKSSYKPTLFNGYGWCTIL